VKRNRTFAYVVALGLVTTMIPSVRPDRSFQGVEGITIGMPVARVETVLRALPGKDSVMPLPDGLSVALPQSDWFRHGYLQFDKKGRLREIRLAVREVRGMECVLEELESAYDLSAAPGRPVVKDGSVVDVRGNQLIVRDASIMMVESDAQYEKEIH
jgi:hypothetical protein